MPSCWGSKPLPCTRLWSATGTFLTIAFTRNPIDPQGRAHWLWCHMHKIYWPLSCLPAHGQNLHSLRNVPWNVTNPTWCMLLSKMFQWQKCSYECTYKKRQSYCECCMIINTCRSVFASIPMDHFHTTHCVIPILTFSSSTVLARVPLSIPSIPYGSEMSILILCGWKKSHNFSL